MTFKKWSIALFAIAMVAPLSASALGISVANVTYGGNGDALLDNGDTVTIDLLLENSGNLDVTGLDVGVFGYDAGVQGSANDNNLVYNSAQSGAGAFGTTFISGFFADGLSAAVNPVENGFGFPLFQTRHVRLFGGISVTPANGDGSNDSGINGLQTNGADVHLQVTFTAQSLGATHGSPSVVSVVFGNGQQGLAVTGGSGQLLSFNNATLDVTVVPEPGTALLMGLGLAGLATSRRR